MKKIFAFFLLLIFINVCTTACTSTASSKPNMIQSKRRFAEYIEPHRQKNPNAVDLSEGPKLNYDAKFGPKSLDFDIKIVDPYQYK